MKTKFNVYFVYNSWIQCFKTRATNSLCNFVYLLERKIIKKILWFLFSNKYQIITLFIAKVESVTVGKNPKRTKHTIYTPKIFKISSFDFSSLKKKLLIILK